MIEGDEFGQRRGDDKVRALRTRPPTRPGVPTEREQAAVEAALARVVDPCSIATGCPISLPVMGPVREVAIDGRRSQ